MNIKKLLKNSGHYIAFAVCMTIISSMATIGYADDILPPPGDGGTGNENGTLYEPETPSDSNFNPAEPDFFMSPWHEHENHAEDVPYTPKKYLLDELTNSANCQLGTHQPSGVLDSSGKKGFWLLAKGPWSLNYSARSLARIIKKLR